MKKIDINEQQRIILEILHEFAIFCENNNLNYFLDAGTLLGAVRHEGFIPWDNDADVCMPRPDFNKFIEILKTKKFKINDFLLLELPESTMFTFAKISDTRTKLIEYPNDNPYECHIYIDVFCKDGLPSNQNVAKKICNKSQRYVLYNWFTKYTLKKWIKRGGFLKRNFAKFICLFIRDENWAIKKQQKFIKQISLKHPYNNCKYVTTLSNGEFYRMCPKECFDEYILQRFGGYNFRIPKKYDTWLKVLYGENYMIPPEKSKQISHDIEAYWLE